MNQHYLIMKSKAFFLANLVLLAVGALLCYLHGRVDILHSIVFITGIALIVPGLLNMAVLRRESTPSAFSRSIGWVTSLAAIALGVVMMVIPGWFIPVLVYLFGALLILAPLAMVYSMSRVATEPRLPGWSYVAPILVLIAGVVMIGLGRDRLTDQYITLITGIGIILFALNAFVVIALLSRKRPTTPSAIDSTPAESTDSTAE